jgi:dienelactone hydrolase
MQPTDYTALAEELASYGYVVAGLFHTYSTPVVVFSDGRLVGSTPKGRLTHDLEDELLQVWSVDIKSTIDEMDRLNNDQHSQFGARLSSERGIMGHSFGGTAAVAACNGDTRCTAVVDLDGTLYGSAATAQLQCPVMFLMGTPYVPPNLPVFRRSRALIEETRARDQREIEKVMSHSQRGYRVTVVRLLHMQFSDSTLFFDPGDAIAKLAGNELDGLRAHTITSSYVRAFFDVYLRHVPGAQLQLGSPSFPEARVITQ